MPGTYRYSATFDKPYVEEPPNSRSPVRFSIGSWHGPNTVPPASSAVVGPPQENPPLNSSYRNHARTASTDSLDSSSCGSSTGSSAGHSRQVSIDGMEVIPTRTIKSSPAPAPTTAASRNPMQFVKVGPVPLYKKAEEQIKLAKETKICRETVKENEEAWQSNLDGWKNRRRKVSEKSIQRLEEMKMIEEEEQNRTKSNNKIKTFTEMMEERAHKPRSYNLAIYVDNNVEGDDENKMNASDDLNLESDSTGSRLNGDSVFENDCVQSKLSNTTSSRPNNNNIHNQNIKLDNGKSGKHKASGSIDDGFAEEDCNGYNLYTGDSGLESFGSSQRVGDLQDSCSELSTDSGSVCDRVGPDDENRPVTPLGQLTTGTDLLEEFSSKKNDKSWPTDLEEKEGHVQISLRMWMKPEIKEKDYGFSLKVEKSESNPSVIVESVKNKSVSQQSGLRKGDYVLAVNGETALGRSHSSIMFSVKQSLYRGHLDMIISRPECDDASEVVDFEEEHPARSKSMGPSERRMFNGRSVDDLRTKGHNREDIFLMRSKSESFGSQPELHRIDLLKENKKVPPPIPVKPKFIKSPNGRLMSSISLENLVDTSRKDFSRSEVNVMDDTIESEADGIEQSMTPLVKTVSNGFRDAAQSPSFDSHDACLSDFNESELDVEKQLESEMVVKDLETNPSNWNDDNKHLVQFVTVTVRDRQESVVEEEMVKETIPETTAFQIETGVHNEIISSKDGSAFVMTHTPLYQENGLNIIFQSHHPKEQIGNMGRSHLEGINSRNQIEDDEAPESQGVCQVTPDVFVANSPMLEESKEQNMFSENRDIPNSPIDNEQDSDFAYSDDYVLTDLDDLPRQVEPPKEKPPPPPPAGDDASVGGQKTSTIKRIKKEIWRRRSDFLGIDPADDVENVDVPPPPPNMSEILKSERDLERRNRVWLERDQAKSAFKKPESSVDEDIVRREREIIENLEREERGRRAQETEKDDQELVSAESKVTTICITEDDERIQRLQDERRRMEEERLQREEQRMRMEEEQMFREREESLQIQEEHGLNISVTNGAQRDCIVNHQLMNEKHVLNSQCPVSDESMTKEALILEKERLRREQEALRKERDEYNHRLEIEQQKRLQFEEQEKQKPGLAGRDAVICASKRPQGFQEDFQKTDYPRSMGRRSSSSSELSSTHDSVKEMELLPNAGRLMKKDSALSLGGAPKARIIQNEQWISQNEKAKRRSEPSVNREGYNQNHWLIQEAEMRRISEQNERQRNYHNADNRRHSTGVNPPRYTTTSPMHSPPRETIPPVLNRGDALRHIASTAPRPYHRPTPPIPPPKPPHGLPAQKEQVWNYRPVTAPVTNVPVHPQSDLGLYSNNAPTNGVVSHLVEPPVEQDQLLSVSGKERCSHCGEPLGRGGAMIIESLQLCYHMHCFCCCVCQAQLGNGTCGTDVRVRNNKLHCQNCYSNDEAGLKFSQV